MVLEEELLHNERLASIGRLAAGVAHEIGNPVTGIACLAQNLEYETDPKEIRHMAQDILKQTGRVTRIVESLMNFSHTGSISGDIKLAPANLADCVDEAIHLLALDSAAKSVQFSNHCDRELLVLADTQRLLQVFVNLLGNARDACDNFGQVQINASATDSEVSVDVADNGCGIPTADTEAIFDRYVQLDAKKKGQTGLGLGLSIVKEMCSLMEMDVALSSKPNEGSVFTISAVAVAAPTWPRAEPPRPDIRDRAPQTPAATSEGDA